MRALLDIGDTGGTPCIVHGPPGMGKTETCIEVLKRLDRKGWQCRDITLQGLNGYAGLFQALWDLAGASGDGTDSKSLLELLRMRLAGGKQILYLDNFEEVLHTGSPGLDRQVIGLPRGLCRIPGLAVLISCRERSPLCCRLGSRGPGTIRYGSG